jgi:hypothetical protein
MSAEVLLTHIQQFVEALTDWPATEVADWGDTDNRQLGQPTARRRLGRTHILADRRPQLRRPV